MRTTLTTISLVIFSFFSLAGYAQQHFTIGYRIKMMEDKGSRNVYNYPSLNMVIRDSVSFTYYPELLAKWKKLPLGSSYIPKSAFSNMAACLYIFPTGEVEKRKTHRLVVDSCKKGNWTITGETQEIAGYNCKKAIGVMNGRSITVWFSPDLPAGFAPFFMHDLPGTVLEYWYENAVSFTTAVAIKSEAEPIVEPGYARRISRAEYDRKRKSP